VFPPYRLTQQGRRSDLKRDLRLAESYLIEHEHYQ